VIAHSDFMLNRAVICPIPAAYFRAVSTIHYRCHLSRDAVYRLARRVIASTRNTASLRAFWPGMAAIPASTFDTSRARHLRHALFCAADEAFQMPPATAFSFSCFYDFTLFRRYDILILNFITQRAL
jgi:hypothetical protein